MAACRKRAALLSRFETTVILLPGALIAGVMGMNFHPSIFQHSFLFWVVNGVIVFIALATLAIARARRWI